MLFHVKFAVLAVLMLSSCISTRSVRSPSGSAVSSFTVGKFTPPPGGAAWASLDISMPRRDGDQREIAKTLTLSDFQGGNSQNVSLVIPQGSYTVAMSYKDANALVVYDVCASAKAQIYDIRTPQFTADIPICKAGTLTQVGSTLISPNSDVVLNPTLRGGGTQQAPAGGSYTGFATNFEALGEKSGGCGVPPAQVESEHFVALNVQQTPNDYTPGLRRPLDDTKNLGLFANGLNCGRWIQVTFGKDCSPEFPNSGTSSANLCPEAKFIGSPHAGAQINLVVTDSCQDGNGWCRDDLAHIDIHTSSLTQFTNNGRTVDVSQNWSNPQVSWKFIPAPNYQGDIKIAFADAWQKYYLPIIITHLPNGIHGVESKVGGVWRKARMNSDNGQVYVLDNGSDIPFQIRIYDANDQLINDGRVYQFGMPASCPTAMNPGCGVNYTPVTYTVFN